MPEAEGVEKGITPKQGHQKDQCGEAGEESQGEGDQGGEHDGVTVGREHVQPCASTGTCATTVDLDHHNNPDSNKSAAAPAPIDNDFIASSCTGRQRTDCAAARVHNQRKCGDTDLQSNLPPECNDRAAAAC